MAVYNGFQEQFRLWLEIGATSYNQLKKVEMNSQRGSSAFNLVGLRRSFALGNVLYHGISRNSALV